MIDLTPLDVRKKKGDFRKKPLGGYDPEEVDNFLDLVEERLEELVREKLNLSQRLGMLESRLETLEGRESAVQEALVSAQELRREVQNQTQKDAEALEAQARREIELARREAESEIASRVQEAEGILKERHRALEELERNRQRFLKAFRSLLEREMDAVEVEEARRPMEDVTLELQLRGWNRGEKGSPRKDGGDEVQGSQGQEPLWLSSLLKQDAREGSEGSGADAGLERDTGGEGEGMGKEGASGSGSMEEEAIS